MKVEGACHCGAITYAAEVEPDGVEICHCADCQTLTGTAYRVSVTTPAANPRLLRGQPSIPAQHLRPHGRERQPPGPGLLRRLRVSALKQRGRLPPRRQFWCRSAQPWANDLGRLPGVERE